VGQHDVNYDVGLHIVNYGRRIIVYDAKAEAILSSHRHIYSNKYVPFVRRDKMWTTSVLTVFFCMIKGVKPPKRYM
jgi:hypothetical protein